jgi:hypothetical protein
MQDSDTDFEQQSTRMIVAGFNRAAKRPILIGAGVVLMLLCAMAFQAGNGRRALLQDNAMLASGRGPDISPDSFKPKTGAVYGLSTVEVVLNSDGELTVDGKHLSTGRYHDVQLTAGEHTMVAHLGDKVLTEKFRTGADESLRFEFQKSRVRVFREVTATP